MKDNVELSNGECEGSRNAGREGDIEEERKSMQDIFSRPLECIPADSEI